MKNLKTVIFLISLGIAVIGGILFSLETRSGQSVSYYVLGMLTYGLIFIIYYLIDSAANRYKKQYREK